VEQVEQLLVLVVQQQRIPHLAVGVAVPVRLAVLVVQALCM